MSNFICPECGKNILEGDNGLYVVGCPHYPTEDFTMLSGRHMSDGKSRGEADLLAFRQMTKQQNLFDK